MVNNY